jgi:hypothetical protein
MNSPGNAGSIKDVLSPDSSNADSLLSLDVNRWSVVRISSLHPAKENNESIASGLYKNGFRDIKGKGIYNLFGTNFDAPEYIIYYYYSNLIQRVESRRVDRRRYHQILKISH